MRKTLFLLAATAGLLAAAPAIAAPPSVCIQHDDIRNWTSLNDKQVVLENYRHQKALLQLIGTCGGFKFSEALVIRSPGETGLSCVSAGDEIQTRQSGFHGRCAIVSVTPYTGAPANPQGDRHGDSY